ncbi:hypothetical protein JST97_18145 [bacterium]|nr:hypothetical protein [bacterium]
MKQSRTRKGFAILLTLFFMVLFSLLGMAYLNLVPFELQAARHQATRDQAMLMTQASLQGVWAWLRYAEDTTGNPTANLTGAASGDPNWPVAYRLDTNPNLAQIPGLVVSPLDANSNVNGDWTCKLTLYPDLATIAGTNLHSFRLRSIAAFRGKDYYAADYLLKQDTFAKYGFFVDSLPNGGFYTAFRDDFYSGEFHINGKMPLYVGANLFSNFLHPVFDDKLTFSQKTANVGNDGIAYQTSTTPFNASGTEIIDANGKGRYSELLTNGIAAIQPGADVALPKPNGTELPYAKAAWFGRNSALDSLASQTIPAGLSLRNNSGTLSGLYIKGDVRSIDLKVVDASGNSVARDANQQINSGNPVTEVLNESDANSPSKAVKVTEVRSYAITVPAGVRIGSPSAPITTGTTNVPVGSTLIKRPAGTAQNSSAQDVYEIYSGYPTGVVYVDGNIGKVDALNTEQAGGAAVNRESLTSSASQSQGGISGINYGQSRTIAVNILNNKYIRVKGDITRGDTNPSQIPTSKRDGLGLVGYDVVIGRENAFPSATPLNLVSLVMAGRRDSNNVTTPGSVIYENWSSTGGTRVMNAVGSYVVGNDRLWGNLSNGWFPSFKHDSVLANSPPPFYPTRADYVLLGSCEVLP